jgi:hypothetical protein
MGQFKLEHTIRVAAFIAPKVYGFITDKGEEIIKVKGLKSIIPNTFADLYGLLIKDSKLDFTQEKWYKSIFEGKISVLDVAYRLKSTTNKREGIYEQYTREYYDPSIKSIVYRNYEVLTKTKPYKYSDIEIK